MDKRVDSDGKGPQYQPGERVYVAPLKMRATVIEQNLSYDYPDCFWGNVRVKYDDGVEGVSNSWQLMKINE
jgi:hypothetical protein